MGMLNKRWAGGCSADRESWGGRHGRQEESRWEQGGRGGSAGEKGRSHRAGRLGREQTAVLERSLMETGKAAIGYSVSLSGTQEEPERKGWPAILQGFLVHIMLPPLPWFSLM